MSPSINITPDMLGMSKLQPAPVPASAGGDLELLCSALDALQISGQADLNALAGCLSRLADCLKNQAKASAGEVSGWTSEPFGVKGMGGMVTCRSDRREVVFNQDSSGQPYMGMWHSRLPGTATRSGSFKIQVGAGGTQLVLEGSRSLQVALPAVGAAAWGSIDAFHQGLNSSRQPSSAPAPAQEPVVMPAQAAAQAPGLMPVNLVCPKCGKALKPGIEFCGNCGTLVAQPLTASALNVEVKTCPKCGSQVNPGVKFCEHCGSRL